MTSFARILRNRFAIADRFMDYVKAAEENREREHNAALRIQQCWQRHRRRQRLAFERRMATLIQKHFRGFQARILVECLAVEKARADRAAYFKTNATKIHKTWRGYRVRRLLCAAGGA
jgi:hypothetical protein